jgi:hypothetical protein
MKSMSKQMRKVDFEESAPAEAKTRGEGTSPAKG